MITIWRDLYDNNVVVGCFKHIYVFISYYVAHMSKPHTTFGRALFILLNSRMLFQVSDGVRVENLIAHSVNTYENNYLRDRDYLSVIGIH